MIENTPSRTAQRVARLRAAHQLLDVPLVLDDPIALRIVGATAAAEIQADPGREDNLLSRSLRAFVVARSRLAEDELARAVARGVRQYVVLGAGLDTFAYRNPYGSRIRIFEVDFPATQAWKRRRLEAGRIGVPPELTYAPIDFRTETLTDALPQSGFDVHQPAFFSWLGVTPYLEPEAAMATLRVIAAFAGAGGGVVFDYAKPPSSLGLLPRLVFNRMAARVKAAGEPFRGFWDPGALVRDLRGLGFTDVADLGPDEINARYFANRPDRLRVNTRGVGRIMCAGA